MRVLVTHPLDDPSNAMLHLNGICIGRVQGDAHAHKCMAILKREMDRNGVKVTHLDIKSDGKVPLDLPLMATTRNKDGLPTRTNGGSLVFGLSSRPSPHTAVGTIITPAGPRFGEWLMRIK